MAFCFEMKKKNLFIYRNIFKNFPKSRKTKIEKYKDAKEKVFFKKSSKQL